MKKQKWDKGDFAKANEVQKMAESQGYQLLAVKWLEQREILIAKSTDDKCQSRDLAVGALKGFDLAVGMAAQIVKEAMDQKDMAKAQKEIEANFED